ncbi:MAG: hypothetical protein QRY72_03280 [Candidatus Rhabdochlamydia sp.]
MAILSSSQSILPKYDLNDLPPFITFELDCKEGACFLQYQIKRDENFAYTMVKNVFSKMGQFAICGGGLGGMITAGTQFVFKKINEQPLEIKNQIYRDVKKQGHILWERVGSKMSFSGDDYWKTVFLGAGIGAMGGATLGMLYGTHHLIKVSIARQQALYKSQQEFAKAQAILNLFLQNNIESFDWACPISHEIMAFPVVTNCKHVFELFSLSLMMQKSRPDPILNAHLCPLCKTAITGITRKDKCIESVTENSHRIFTKLEQILAQSHLIDGLNADEIRESVEEGKIFLNRPIEDLAAFIEKDEQLLSREELFALAAYVLTQFDTFHKNVTQVYVLSNDALNKLILQKKISLENANELKLALEKWYLRREFIPQQCVLVRRFYNAL